MPLVDSPVFLVGSVRSGTTLLRLMLDHHPRIAFNLESEYLVRQVSDDGKHPDMAQYRAWLREDRMFQHSRFSVDERLDFLGLVNDFLSQKRARDSKEFVGATVHVQFHKLHRIWPNARYVHIYRDGRDVANSAMRMGWAGNIYVAADMWLTAVKEWERLRPMLRQDAWLEVRYEDLIANPRSELKRICEFIGVEFSERMFDYASKTSYELPDVTLNYQWKTGMRRLDVQRLEAKMGDQLSAMGYAPSGYPRVSVSRPLRSWLYFDSRFGAFLFRLRRYGVALTLREALFRRLGLRKAHEIAMREMNVITDATLK
ncbi:MAG: sulfotransferase [Chthoniobacteraceae bacterium]